MSASDSSEPRGVLDSGAPSPAAPVDSPGQRLAWPRPLAVRVGINTVTLLGVIALFALIRLPGQNSEGRLFLDEPLLQIQNASLLDFILLGLAMAVVGAFVRPLLTALSGSLVLRTYGLMIFVINAIVFWLAVELVTMLSHMTISVPDPRIVWVLVVSSLFSLSLLLVNTILGLNRPRLQDVGETQPMWRLLDGVPLSRRNRLIENLRLQQVREIIFEFGVDISLSGSPIAGLRNTGDWLLGRETDDFDAMETPAKVRIMLQQLGPTYVKVGQMVSSRADMLPEPWRVELDKLQSAVPPFPYEQVEAVVTSELGATPADIFSTFDHEPLGAASLAQVHRATLPDGTEVVVKVQRPDVNAMVRADLGNMEDLAQQAERRVSIARTLNMTAMIHEFGDGVIKELDYRNEAYHALRLAEVCESIEGVTVPPVYLDYSSKRVMTMGLAPGVNATQLDALDAAGVDRDEVARALIRAMIKQVLIEGFFHGDPHPGNIIIDTETGVVTFIDMGLVGELDSSRRIQLMGLMWSLRQRDSGGLATAILGLCERTGPVDETSFRSEIRRVVYQYWIYGNANFSRLMTAMFSILSAHNLRLDRSLTLAVKALVQTEELVRTLSPQLPLVDTGYELATEMLETEFTSDRILELAKEQATATVIELGRRLPSLREATFSWLDQYQKGKFVVTIDTGDLQKGLKSAGSVSRNLAIGLVVAGQLIAVALVLAVLLATNVVSEELASLVTAIFIGFLVFSLWTIRRVSKSPD